MEDLILEPALIWGTGKDRETIESVLASIDSILDESDRPLNPFVTGDVETFTALQTAMYNELCACTTSSSRNGTGRLADEHDRDH